MKTHFQLVLALGTLCTSSQAAVLWMDNFNTADTANFDAAPLTGRLSGSQAGNTYLRSFSLQQTISNNRLLMPSGGNGVRFELATNDPVTTGAADRFDWAAGSAGTAILGAGGFVVSFDWIAANTTSTDWVSFQVGTINADNGNLTNDDYGILFRNNGGTERFDAPVNLGAGGSFTPSAGGVVRRVEIAYALSSFADGSSVKATSKVDGVQVASDTFTWDGNAGGMRMELGNGAANTAVDNLTISTIPEPTGSVLAGLAMIGVTLRRRR